MNAVLPSPFVERFREPNTLFLSPARVSEFFGFQIQELAERAHVHRNTPAARPQALQAAGAHDVRSAGPPASRSASSSR